MSEELVLNQNELIKIEEIEKFISERKYTKLKDMLAEVNPAEILLVIDAMTGQEAANVAETFNNRLDD